MAKGFGHLKMGRKPIQGSGKMERFLAMGSTSKNKCLFIKVIFRILLRTALASNSSQMGTNTKESI